MKKFLALLFLLPAALLAIPVNVQKDGGALTQSFTVPSGVTISATGTGAIHATSVNGGTAASLTSLSVRSTGAAFDLTIASSEVLTAGRTLSLNVGDAARSVTLGGNLTLAGSFTTSGAFASTFTMTGTTTVTFPTSGTLATTAGTVSSITGTANQVAASASTGAVTLSLAGPHNFTTLTSTAVLLGAGTSAIAAANMTYVTPTLSVPAGFNIAPASGQFVVTLPDAVIYHGVQTAPALLSGDSGVQYVATGNYSGLSNTTYANGVALVYPYFHTLAANGTAASPTNYTAAAIEGSFIFGAYANSAFRQNAEINATTDAAFGNTEYGATLNFRTKGGTGGMTTWLSLDKAGLVTFVNRALFGASDDSSTIVNISNSLTGGTSRFGYAFQGTALSGVTVLAEGYYSALATQATSFTLATFRAYGAHGVAPGAGSTVTNYVGFYSQNTAGATNRFAFQGAMTASGTAAWNAYMDGTAPNYFAGEVYVGSSTDLGAFALQVTGASTFTGTMTVPTLTPPASTNLTINSIGGENIILRTGGSSSGVIGFGGISTSGAGNIHWNFTGGTSTATSGVADAMAINATVNQASGTGGHNGLRISITETAVLGSGAYNLIAAYAGAAGTTEKFRVTNAGAVVAASTITTLGGATFHTTSSALTDGAGASLGTLATAPSAGNPTKWIGINDNGTTRYVPAW